MTNEEWLRNASDEELCELLLKIAFMCSACGVSIFSEKHSYIADDECLSVKNGYCIYCSAKKTMEWLKQPCKE